MKFSRNPMTGRLCSGFRFRFHVPAIDPKPLYLPLEMKDHPLIKGLMLGVTPLEVFHSCALADARRMFRNLRKSFDFDFWAFKEFFIPDLVNPDSLVPLRLNDAQFKVIDILRKRYYNKEKGRYVISKSIRRCGLTTCIQAYILWMQTYRHRNNSYLCGPSEIGISPIKKNLCRHLHRDIVPQDPWIFLPKVDRRAFFFTFRSPDAVRGIDLGYVHCSNMSHWQDTENKYTSRAFIASASAVLLDYFTLVILEGDLPHKSSFCLKGYLKTHVKEKLSLRYKNLPKYSSNPFFINEVMVAMTRKNPHFFHIHLHSSPKNHYDNFNIQSPDW